MPTARASGESSWRHGPRCARGPSPAAGGGRRRASARGRSEASREPRASLGRTLKLQESDAIFFDGPAEFRRWLESNHESAAEVFVGYYKKATGRQTMTWSQAVDQALCFGWIDGVLRRIDDERHMQRFTPRRPGSNWSKVNVEKMARLEGEGLVAPAGRRAFEARSEAKTGVYSFEQAEAAALPPKYAERLNADSAAVEFLAGQPPWYRRVTTHWVVSAKKEETRLRRLGRLIAASAQGERLRQFNRNTEA